MLQYNLPPQVARFLANPPPPGQPIHHWLFRAASLLHKCQIQQAEIEVMIAQAVTRIGRARSATEIADAVRNSAPGNNLSTCGRRRAESDADGSKAAKTARVAVDGELRQRVISESTLGGLDGLKGMSPVQDLADKDPRFYLEQLFPDDPLVCLGMNMSTSFTRRLSEHVYPLACYQLVVPSPMCELQGLTQKGKLSDRSLSNVGPRHYLVTEFDQGSFEEQAAVIEHLSQFAPLVMVVFSGKKSLHAWWPCKGESDECVERFFRYAVKLGADPATWCRVQLCRLPEGTRNGKTAQSVYYFNPSVLVGGKEGT